MAALKLMRRIVPSERGAELIEFALVLPMLLLLVLGIVDFGFLFQRLEVVTNAAREGARIAVLPSYDNNDIRDRVNTYLAQGGVPVSPGNPDIRIYDVPITLSGGGVLDAYQVQVTYFHSYLFLSGLSRLFGGSFSSVPLKAVSTMRIESSGS